MCHQCAIQPSQSIRQSSCLSVGKQIGKVRTKSLRVPANGSLSRLVDQFGRPLDYYSMNPSIYPSSTVHNQLADHWNCHSNRESVGDAATMSSFGQTKQAFETKPLSSQGKVCRQSSTSSTAARSVYQSSKQQRRVDDREIMIALPRDSSTVVRRLDADL